MRLPGGRGKEKGARPSQKKAKGAEISKGAEEKGPLTE